MLEVKLNNKTPKKYIAAAEMSDNCVSDCAMCGNTYDLLTMLIVLTQDISNATKTPLEVITRLINEAPRNSDNSTTITVDMNEIGNMFGKRSDGA